jgi:hypothetical protein
MWGAPSLILHIGYQVIISAVLSLLISATVYPLREMINVGTVMATNFSKVCKANDFIHSLVDLPDLQQQMQAFGNSQ